MRPNVDSWLAMGVAAGLLIALVPDSAAAGASAATTPRSLGRAAPRWLAGSPTRLRGRWRPRGLRLGARVRQLGRALRRLVNEPVGDREAHVYKALGARLFSRYYPNRGSYWLRGGRGAPVKLPLTRSRVIGRVGPQQEGRPRDRALKRVVEECRADERVHLGAGVCLLAMTPVAAIGGWPFVAALTGVNFLANGLPLMSLRLTRHRAQRLLDRASGWQDRPAAEVAPTTHPPPR